MWFIKMKKICILYNPSGNPVREIKLKGKKKLAQEGRVFEAEPTIESFTIGNERNCDFRNLREAHESLFGYTCVGW